MPGDSHRSDVNRPPSSDPDDLVYGRHAVEEALARGDVRQLLLDAAAGSGGRELADEARKRNVDVRVLPPEAFASLARGRPFQGVAARVTMLELLEAGYLKPLRVARRFSAAPDRLSPGTAYRA